MESKASGGLIFIISLAALVLWPVIKFLFIALAVIMAGGLICLGWSIIPLKYRGSVIWIILIICLFSGIFIASIAIQKNPEIVANYAPHFASDSLKLSAKIKGLKEIRDALNKKLTGLQNSESGFEKSIREKGYGISASNQDYDLILLEQEKGYLSQIRLQKHAIGEALKETQFLIKYANNRLVALDGSKDNADLIDKIDRIATQSNSALNMQ